jgi:hypothetical protein
MIVAEFTVSSPYRLEIKEAVIREVMMVFFIKDILLFRVLELKEVLDGF